MTDNNTNITELLKKATNDLLTEDTLSAIEEAFNAAVETRTEEALGSKVELHVEKALLEQDEDHAKKLESLLEAIDTDHTAKLQKVIKAINENHTDKLRSVVKRYKGALISEAKEFKKQMVDTVSKYLDVYLENAVPTQDIKEAVKNRKALDKLNEMRRFLGVDLAVGKESIRTAIIDGKKQIEEGAKQLNTLVEKNEKINTELHSLRREKLLNEKTEGLPTAKKNYILKVLSDKPLDFINENFDYTLKMFEKTEEERLDELKAQAIKGKPAVDRPKRQQPVINEGTDQRPSAKDSMGYLSELSKF